MNQSKVLDHMRIRIAFICWATIQRALHLPDIMELLDFAAGSGKWSSATEQMPVGCSTEMYVAIIGICDFVQKIRWAVGSPDTVHKRVF